MFTPILRALGQLSDPAILGVLLRTLLVSVLCFAALIAGSAAGLHHVLAAHATLAAIASVFGGLVGLAAALWLFLPLAVVIAGLFLGSVCAAVERRWYPHLPPPAGAGFAQQVWDGLVIGVQILGLNILSLILYLVPGPGWLAAYLVTAWAIGRGMFISVALRRMRRHEAVARYRDQWWQVMLQGAALTLAGAVPVLNFLIPIIGPAAMVHVLMGVRMGEGRRAETWG
jgi:CysZ protein